MSFPPLFGNSPVGDMRTTDQVRDRIRRYKERCHQLTTVMLVALAFATLSLATLAVFRPPTTAWAVAVGLSCIFVAIALVAGVWLALADNIIYKENVWLSQNPA